MPENTDLQFRQTETLEGWEDAFGELVTKGHRNVLDLPAFYDFSEERYRFIENGERIKNPNEDSTRFTDQSEQFLIEPEAGDNLQFKTAEAPRYIVGNDADVSWSFKFIDPLVDDTDSLKLFVEDSFEIEYLGDGSVTFRSLEDGEEKASKVVEKPNGLTDPSRLELEFNWYAVGRAEVVIDFTEDNEQQSTEPATLTVDDDWLSDDPTGRIGFELDVTNSGIRLEAGSMGYIVKTDSLPTVRPKPHVFSQTELNQVAETGYTVVGACRIDPERSNVFTTISNVSVFADQSVDVELSLVAVPESETDADFIDVADDGTDAGPAYPRNNDPQNSIIQWTPNVSTFPTQTYPIDGSTIPNGRSIGLAVQDASGQGSQTFRQTDSFLEPRPLYPDDVLLMIGHTPNQDDVADVSAVIKTGQDW